MATASALDEAADLGRLANNFMLVQGLRTSLSRTEMNASTIHKQVSRIIAEDAWRGWINPEDGRPHGKGNSADFRQFITSPWPEGCGAEIHVLERMIRGTAAWEPYLDATRGMPG